MDEIDGLKGGPSRAGSLEYWYAPQFAPPATDATVIETAIPVGWEDYVVYQVVAQLLAKEESDPSFWMQERDRAMQRILAAMTPRDAGEPKAVSDHYNRWGATNDWVPCEDRSMRYLLTGNNIRIIEWDYLGV
jgi:hypothetical protein